MTDGIERGTTPVRAPPGVPVVGVPSKASIHIIGLLCTVLILYGSIIIAWSILPFTIVDPEDMFLFTTLGMSLVTLGVLSLFFAAHFSVGRFLDDQ